MTESAVKVTAHRGYRALKRLLGGHGLRTDELIVQLARAAGPSGRWPGRQSGWLDGQPWQCP